MEIIALVSAFNEGKYIAGVTLKAKKYCKEVIVVDDGSGDNTADEAKSSGATVLKHSINRGKGAAIVTGLGYLEGKDFDAVVLMDGDAQHDPDDIPVLAGCMEGNSADIVIGSRMHDPENMPRIRLITNKFMSWLLRKYTGVSLSDTQCGFRLIRKHVLDNLNLNTDKFEIESELIIKASARKFKVLEAPVKTIYGSEKSKIRPFRDTLRFIKFMLSVKKGQNAEFTGE
ncbi:MAG: glycosyltransferase family 2 protein [Candidatus Aureabacteria bacterium]|nr:glycosyltransferase family 2 protein [Candidatus Auribacterota bacterium]